MEQDVVLTLVLAPLSWVWDIYFYIHCKKGPIPGQQEGQMVPSVQSNKPTEFVYLCLGARVPSLQNFNICEDINILSCANTNTSGENCY